MDIDRTMDFGVRRLMKEVALKGHLPRVSTSSRVGEGMHVGAGITGCMASPKKVSREKSDLSGEGLPGPSDLSLTLPGAVSWMLEE